MNDAIDRIEVLLQRSGRGALWHDQRVPAAALVELMEHTAALLRRVGADLDAERLDGLRRDFLAGVRPPLLNGRL